MKQVLVVDDTKNIRTLLTKCLELEGYKVVTANDGNQALELLEKEIFDLVFLDIKMPNISGTEVLKRMRKNGITIPVIIITAYATIKNAVECTRMGAVAYLQKPFTAEKVNSVLNELFGRVCCSDMKKDKNQDVIQKIEDAINDHTYYKALDMLSAAISTEPTNPYVYLLFSKAYNGVGDIKYASKFKSMYEIIKC